MAEAAKTKETITLEEARATKRRTPAQGSSGGSKTTDAPQRSAQSDQELVAGGAPERATPGGDAVRDERGMRRLRSQEDGHPSRLGTKSRKWRLANGLQVR